ncbi:spermidine/putrescine transport system permease protein [Nitratireductor aquibiodomus]|uniref:Spermidine/putrescine transport system permease protein n=1 Tax=Nitratireductor aquibiodomus TaxID=204799 RepID=A0A1H4JCR9_9HYPH|nr:ABC transporter permease [Nitratireductor aquibiodomus]SEB44083.1 spermidine/putrescine transport system permease protein [Nitratireductor aquibiodomus]
MNAIATTPPRAGKARSTRWIADSAFMTFVCALMAFLYLPIAVLIVFSFNDSRTLTWPLSGFTLDWYVKLFSNTALLEALGNSLYVASCATALTLMVGIPAAIALDRHQFPGKAVFRRLLLLPIALPGIVTGISMLNMFRIFGFGLSLETVILGHATALLAVVVTQIFARLQRVPKSYGEASSDLGANGLQTFWYVTLPNIKTAIIGAGLLSFVLSFDEIPVTFFLTGRDNTLPMYIYSTMRRGITPEINAIGTLIVLASALLILASVLVLRDRSQRS